MANEQDPARHGRHLRKSGLDVNERWRIGPYRPAIGGDSRNAANHARLRDGAGLTGGAHRPHFAGAVTPRGEHFDPDALWRLVERERVTQIAIVGDAFARPMLAVPARG